MTGTLLTKTASAYRTDDGQDIPDHTLYTFVDSDGNGPGVWYETKERAVTSFTRWLVRKMESR